MKMFFICIDNYVTNQKFRKADEIVDFFGLSTLQCAFHYGRGWQSDLHLRMQKVSYACMDLEIFKDLNNKVEVPSHFTLSRDVKEIFEMSRKQVAAIRKVHAL